MVNKYVGARYVPKFYEGSNGNQWDSNVEYEPLTIVTYLTNSYTSQKTVPASVGNPIDNPEYWVATGNYNAQVETYRQAVLEYKSEVDTAVRDFENYKLGNYVTPEMYGAAGDGSTDDTSAIRQTIASGKPVLMVNDYKITAPLELESNILICRGNIYAVNCTAIKITNREGHYEFHNIIGRSGIYGIEMDVPPASTARAITAQNYIRFENINGFSTGIYMHTSVAQKGIQYNTFEFGVVEECGNCIEMNSAANCWINSNTFRGNRLGGNCTHSVVMNSHDRDGINANIFDSIGYEGLTGDAIVMTGADDNMFLNCRMMESMDGDYWINMEKSYRNYFDGGILISWNKIRDVDTFGIEATDANTLCNSFYNEIHMTFALSGVDSWRGSHLTVYSYCGFFYVDRLYSTVQAAHNWLNYTPTTINMEEQMVNDGYAISDGFFCIVKPNITMVMPRWFTTKFNKLFIQVWGAGTVTIKNYYGTTIGTITAPSDGGVFEVQYTGLGITYNSVTRGA